MELQVLELGLRVLQDVHSTQVNAELRKPRALSMTPV